MAVVRDHPYGNARFRVEIPGIEEDAFAEVYLPELTTAVVEHRDGSDRDGAAHLLPGRPQLGRLILRRGFRGSLSLHQWYRQVAEGDAGARRDVLVQLFDEGMAAVVATWRLHAAWPVKYSVSPLCAAGNEVVVEEVELVGERLELE
jgi:phage tail-like protein